MGDLDFTTSNEIIINGIYELPAINCKGQSADKIAFPTKQHFIDCIKSSFGNKVGSVTNYGSSCYDKISLFEEGSEEYKEIDYRIQCIQYFQQECIDSAKNGKPPKPIPKYWHDYKAPELQYKIDEETGEVLNTEEEIKQIELYKRVLTEKKPYFFRYIYSDVNREYNNFKKKTDTNCARRFRCTIDELKIEEHLTDEQVDFLDWYERKKVLSCNPCVVNKIAWIVEKNFDSYNRNKKIEFDYSCYINNNFEIITDSKVIKDIKKESVDYINSIKNQYSFNETMDKNEIPLAKNERLDIFTSNLMKLIPNKEVLTNTLIHLAYEKSSISKGLLWNVCGKQVLDNLLKNKNNKITYPTRDEKGDMLYNGNLFSMKELIIKKGEDNDI